MSQLHTQVALEMCDFVEGGDHYDTEAYDWIADDEDEDEISLRHRMYFPIQFWTMPATDDFIYGTIPRTPSPREIAAFKAKRFAQLGWQRPNWIYKGMHPTPVGFWVWADRVQVSLLE